MIWDEEVALKQGGTYETLLDYFNKRIVKALPVIESQRVTPSSSAVALLPSTLVSGFIAKGMNTLTHQGIMAAPLDGSTNGGVVGVASNKYEVDIYGKLLNRVSIRKASTNEPILIGNKQVFGLIQCNTYIDDGDEIGGVGAENLQISFVYQADNESIVTVALSVEIEFQVNIVVVERLGPSIELETGGGGSTFNVTTEGEDKNEVFTQVAPSLSWTINHSLGKYPCIQLVDTSGNEIGGAVQYTSASQIVVTFDIAVAGKAFLN